MKENWKSFENIIKEKVVWIPLLLTAICSYGFFITNFAIGLDDTSVPRYYVEGRAPAMGRYTMYILERICRVAEFSPFIMEFISILLLMVTAIVCIVLFKKIIGDVIPMAMYSIFACVFISFPLFNEILAYYVHGTPGIPLGYLLIALSVLWLYDYLQSENRREVGVIFPAIIAVYFALGLYESFALVYIMLCATTVLLYSVFKKENLILKRLLFWIGIYIIPLFLAVLFRSLTYKLLATAFDIPNHMRGVSDIRWMFGPDGGENIKTLLRDIFAMYGVNAFFYLPIRNFLLAGFGFVIYIAIKSIKKKNGWIALGGFGILFSPWLLMPVEGVVTTYRANLGLAFLTALALMLVFYEIYNRIKWKWIVLVIAGIIIYNQSFDLNHWFFVEYQKYQYQVELTSRIYDSLTDGYDLEKPIVFISNGEIPEGFADYTHITYADDGFEIIEKVQAFFGIELPERYFDSKGYTYVEVPDLWLYNWGQNAFEEGSTEIAKFFAMHGYEIIPGTNGNWQEAMVLGENMTEFPEEGSIVELERYIIVRLGD